MTIRFESEPFKVPKHCKTATAERECIIINKYIVITNCATRSLEIIVGSLGLHCLFSRIAIRSLDLHNVIKADELFTVNLSDCKSFPQCYPRERVVWIDGRYYQWVRTDSQSAGVDCATHYNDKCSFL